MMNAQNFRDLADGLDNSNHAAEVLAARLSQASRDPGRPKITDDDNATISVTVDDEIKMSWVYADDGDRQEKMRHAHYWCDGYMAGAGALLKHVGQ